MMRRNCLPTLALLCVGLLCLQTAPVPADDAPPAQPSDAKQIPGWGRWLDPDGDCQYRVDDGRLTITVPGWEHDLSAEMVRMNAPRVLQEMTGDFTIQVKVSGKFEPGEAAAANRLPYQGAGLVLMQDNRSYVRLERATQISNRGQVVHYINFEVRLNGAVQRFGPAADSRVEANSPIHLKLERRAEKVTGLVSKDGKDWQELGVKTLTTAPKLNAGVVAINLSTNPFEPQFEKLSLAAIEPEETEAADKEAKEEKKE